MNAIPKRRLLGVLVLLSSPLVASAASLKITVDTSDLSGTQATLALDLIDGGLPANTITIAGFMTDGVVGTSSSTGAVTGSFPGAVTLSDSEFFNEYLQNLTLGTILSFTFDSTGNTAEGGSSPDGFSGFLLDATTGLPLFSTSDPTEADALFLVDIGTPSALSIYSPRVTVSPVGEIPLPGALVFFTTALMVGSSSLRRKAA